MPVTRFTMQLGKPGLKDVEILPGVAEAQSDTVSVNIDYTKARRSDVLTMLGNLKQAIHAGKWPPVQTEPVPPAGFVFLVNDDGSYRVDTDGAFFVEAI